MQMQNTAKQNYPGLVMSYNTRPENEVGLFYDASSPHRVLRDKYLLADAHSD